MNKVKKGLLIFGLVMLCVLSLLSAVVVMAGIVKLQDAEGKPAAVKIQSNEATSSESSLSAVVTVKETPTGIQVQDSFDRENTTSGWGEADIGGTWLHRYHDGSEASSVCTIDTSQGKMTITTPRRGSVSVLSYIGDPATQDYDLKVTAQSNNKYSWLMVVGRVTDYNRFYAADLDLGANTFRIRLNNGGSWSTLASGPSPSPALAAGTLYVIRFQVQGTSLRAKWWILGNTEPTDWAVQVTDSTFSAGQVGVVGYLYQASATSNMPFDDFLAQDVP